MADQSSDKYNRSPDRSVEQGAEAAHQAGLDVANLVAEKQRAYGDSSGVQHKIWSALMQQYRVGFDGYEVYAGGGSLDGGQDVYIIPVALMDHIPRLTRVFDRICRIVGNPAQDRMGEDPWRDLAGDAVCGIVMPRTPTPQAPDHTYRGADTIFTGHDPIEAGESIYGKTQVQYDSE